ncbi:hypothetical protein Aple_039430 [Acrocarpospora pleiomorpha]|uniref:Lipoprotein n=1 Tax=Acrocarpospora pleiomorpha TaxID=90975 RepID=A0A5M3XHR9_9ACTN|nr:hypothetical protein [Acrocarpospora pleiomorpha]GES21047.1 hypothetical protein Aple_039430 [Acrocarpospora pleiomorpha]
MRTAGIRLLTWMTMLSTVAACAQEQPATQATVTPSSPAPQETPKNTEPRGSDYQGPDSSWYEAKLTLADGRQVAMHYRRGKGLYEQHTQVGGWTTPHLIYRTKTDACQGITLQSSGDTVTAIADFGVYCSDGEPPTESIAAVAVGDLRKWDHHLTKNFDGWKRATITDRGRKATFRAGRSTLTWTSISGFSDPVHKYPG